MKVPSEKLVESLEQAQEILDRHETGDDAEEVVGELTELLASDAMIAAVREAHGEAKGDDLQGTLQRLYDAEVNLDVSSLYDSGWTVKLGDGKNGFRAERTFDGRAALGEIASWLDAVASRLYPHYAWRRRTSAPPRERPAGLE